MATKLTIDDFKRSELSHGDRTRTVFRRRSGPAVIVMAELPGITPNVLRFRFA